MKIGSGKIIFLLTVILLTSIGSIRGQETGKSVTNGTIQNVSEDISFISVDDLKSKMQNGEKVLVIDVRGQDYDTSATKIKGAMRVAPADIEAQLKNIPHDRAIVTYCACPTDGGAISAARLLQKNGYKQVHVLKGGWNTWNKLAGAVETK